MTAMKGEDGEIGGGWRVRTFSRVPMILRFVLIAGIGVSILLTGLAFVTPANAADADTVINIVGGAYSPMTTTVTAGTRVVFVNRQPEGSQTATSDTGIFDTGNLMPGQSYFYVFSQPGTYPYHSDRTQNTHGTIIVIPAFPPVVVQVPAPPAPRATVSGLNIPQSQIGNVNQLPGPAAPPSYLPLASAPPPLTRATPVGFSTYGYPLPTAVAPGSLPRTGGGGLAPTFSNETTGD